MMSQLPAVVMYARRDSSSYVDATDVLSSACCLQEDPEHHTSVSSMEPPGASNKHACWQGLPEDILCQVLQYVDCKKRLSCCAQVAQAWHSASAAATTDLNLVYKRSSMASLGEWLQKHGNI
jgi:hypothetical protein